MRAVISVLDQIHTEFKRATALHGPFPTRHHALAVIEEEFIEFQEEVFKNPTKMREGERQKWAEDMKKELIQLGAMAVRAILDLKLEPEEGKETPYDRQL